MFEVELKYPADSHDEIRQKLIAMDTVPIGTSHHCDEYFNQTLLDFARNDIALRIRSQESSHTLTYKGPNLDTRAKIREEIEISLNTNDKDKFRKMLFGMGFHSVITVRKHRESIKVDWHEQTAEICLDTIEGVGTFVELELVVQSKQQIDTAKLALESLATEIGITAEPTTVSYLEMLLDNQS